MEKVWWFLRVLCWISLSVARVHGWAYRGSTIVGAGAAAGRLRGIASKCVRVAMGRSDLYVGGAGVWMEAALYVVAVNIREGECGKCFVPPLSISLSRMFLFIPHPTPALPAPFPFPCPPTNKRLRHGLASY